MIRVKQLLGALATVALASAAAQAGPPTDIVKTHVEQALEVLAKQGEADSAKRRESIRQIAQAAFDFPDMARRTLGQHWRQRSPEERERFTRLFTHLLERAYFSRIDSFHQGSAVKYIGEDVDGPTASVKTVVVTDKGSTIPVEYLTHKVDGRWRIYDVKIESVSLVSNYRAQFNKVIVSSSFEELLRRLEQRSGALPAVAPTGG
ncbi:MAG TPA: ABC transporter substrate-binding protein [Methylomirabilota bacterium]|nr:ABC transporter substrate-binding protein [Methylomirabilota bacterium]